MKQSRLVLVGFLLVGAVAIAVSVALVHQLSVAVEEIQSRHSPALESILEVRGRIGDAVQSSFAYLVTRAHDDKQTCLDRFAEVENTLSRFAHIARVDTPGEEDERRLWGQIIELQPALEHRATALFSRLETTSAIDTTLFQQYEDVIERLFSEIDELAGLEQHEVATMQTLMVRTVHRAQISLWAIASTVVFLTTVVGIVLRRALHSAERARAERQASRDRFVERSIAVQDSERRRIARELHDETGQGLSALAIGLRGLCAAKDLASVRDQAERLHRTAHGLVHNISRLVLGLHPHVIEDHGLVAAVEHLASEFGESHDIAVDVDVASIREPLPLGADDALAVYRIVQEALTNVARHANATEVCISLCLRGSELRAMVEDNGCGFHIDASRSRAVGLQSMRERAATLGGQLTVESELGSGTTIVIDVALHHEDAQEKA